MHMMPCALVFALDKGGRSIAARMAMIAMTTNSSIRVKPTKGRLFFNHPGVGLAVVAIVFELFTISSLRHSRRSLTFGHTRGGSFGSNSIESGGGGVGWRAERLDRSIPGNARLELPSGIAERELVFNEVSPVEDRGVGELE